MNIPVSAELTTLQTIGIAVGIIVGIGTLVFRVVLGVLNYRHQRYMVSPDIEVRPSVLGNGASGNGMVSIRNNGVVPIVFDHLGYLLKRRDDKGNPLLQDEPLIDFELKPHHSTNMRFKLSDLPEAQKVAVIYVQSSNCKRFKAERPDMQRFRKELAEYQHRLSLSH